MWELDYKESWALKNWCFWTVAVEKTFESPLDCKEIQPVHPKGNQSWIFIGRTDAEAEAPILWPPHVRNQLIGRDPNAGKDWKKEDWKKEGGGGADRRWHGWTASLTWWTFAWATSGSWWWTMRPGVLQSTGLQRVGQDWAAELNWDPGGASGEEPTYWCRRGKKCGFDPWVGKIPWRRPQRSTPVFLPGEAPSTEEPGRLESAGLQSVSPMTETTWHARAHSWLTTWWWFPANSGGTRPDTHVYPLSPTLPSPPGYRDTETSSLRRSAGPCCWSILNTAACTCASQRP